MKELNDDYESVEEVMEAVDVSDLIDTDVTTAEDYVADDRSFDEIVKDLSNDSLMAANLTFILTMRHESTLSKSDASSSLTKMCDVMKKLDDNGFFKKFSVNDRDTARAIVSRAAMVNNLTAESVVAWYKAGVDAVTEQNTYVPTANFNELAITTLCRAMSKFSDFAYSLVVYGDMYLDKYDEIVDNSNKVFVEFIARSSSVFKKIKANDQKASSLMFLSLIEDILASTLNPLIEAISNDAVLRKQFVNNSQATLQTIRVHLNKKFNNTILLANELLELSKQERYSGAC